MIDRNHGLSIVRQARALAISRGSVYYAPRPVSANDLALMKLIDRQYLMTPFYGARKMAAWLKSQRHKVNRKRHSTPDASNGSHGHLPAPQDQRTGEGP